MNEVKVLDNGNVLVTIPIVFRQRAKRRRMIFEENDSPEIDPLVMHIVRAFRWQALIDTGVYQNTIDLAKAVGRDKAYVSRTLRLTLLAPEIVHAIIAGTLEKSIPQRKFRQEFPVRWSEQKKFFGIE